MVNRTDENRSRFPRWTVGKKRGLSSLQLQCSSEKPLSYPLETQADSSIDPRTFIWGYGICYSVILLHLQSSQHWQQKGLASLASVGTVQLGLMYFLTFFVNAWFKRYSNHAKTALYAAAVIYPLSLLLSSFATEVSHLSSSVSCVGTKAQA
jgi:hypothetical protein